MVNVRCLALQMLHHKHFPDEQAIILQLTVNSIRHYLCHDTMDRNPSTVICQHLILAVKVVWCGKPTPLRTVVQVWVQCTRVSARRAPGSVHSPFSKVWTFPWCRTLRVQGINRQIQDGISPNDIAWKFHLDMDFFCCFPFTTLHDVQWKREGWYVIIFLFFDGQPSDFCTKYSWHITLDGFGPLQRLLHPPHTLISFCAFSGVVLYVV